MLLHSFSLDELLCFGDFNETRASRGISCPSEEVGIHETAASKKKPFRCADAPPGKKSSHDSPVLLTPLMTSGFSSLKYGQGWVP